MSVSKKYLDVGGNVAVDDGNDEPLMFGQRAVLKCRGRVAVSKLVGLHRAHKNCAVLASELVAMANQKLQLTGSPDPTPKERLARNELEILNRGAIRCLLEE